MERTNEMTYEEECTKYFAPLDEISEAINNNEGMCGISFDELRNLVALNEEMKADLYKATGTVI